MASSSAAVASSSAAPSHVTHSLSSARRRPQRGDAATVPSARNNNNSRTHRRVVVAGAGAARRSSSVAFVDVVDEADAGTTLKPFQEGMQKVTMFGISHMTNNVEAAEHILRTKPRSVVVETALCKQHSAARGTSLNFSDIFAAIHVFKQEGAEESLQFITNVAHQLRLEEHPLEESALWANMKTQLPAEPLVYAAAFAVDARLVFGDRPKETTYRRLVSCPTLSQLDETFGNQSARNYRLLLPEDHPQVGVSQTRSNLFSCCIFLSAGQKSKKPKNQKTTMYIK